MVHPASVGVLLDRVSTVIHQSRERLTETRDRLDTQITNLTSIPVTYADLIATINDPAYGGDANENANKARLAAMTTEFQALKAEAQAVKTWIDANVTEF